MMVREMEEFEMKSLQSSTDLKPCLRRLHLGVMAIREYQESLETYSRPSSTQKIRNGSSQGCEEGIILLVSHLPAIRDLRQLFILQLRLYNPIIQSRRYLRDVITANHVLLLTFERAVQGSSESFDFRQHLNQFCSRTIISHYGTALEDFKTNGTFVNDCIFTFLHHIGTDLGRSDLLCEPVILSSFRKIWEEEFDVSILLNETVHLTCAMKYDIKQDNSEQTIPGMRGLGRPYSIRCAKVFVQL